MINHDTPWRERPSIDIDLSLPVAQRFAVIPSQAIGECKALLAAILAQIPVTAKPLADAVRIRTGGRFHEAACALAELHGLSWRDVMLANVSYDLFLASLGCSTVALPTQDGPVIARNMDWMPEQLLARASYLIRYVRGGKLEYAHAAWPASIGVVSGLSARGFALIVNAVRSPEGVNMSGYPVLLFLRRVLEEAPDFTAALKLITQETLAMSALITLVGSENDQRVVIERSPTKHALRWGEPGKPLMTTNHYRILYPLEQSKPAGEFGCSRFDRLCALLGKHDAHSSPGDEHLLRILSDPQVIQEITAQHILIRPRRQEMKLFVPSRLV
jgi:hypothetical protein